MKKSIMTFLLLSLSILMISLSDCKKDDENITTVRDIDGNIYNTVSIGTQVWLKENLNVTKYRNGDPISTTVPKNQDISDEIAPKYQWVYNSNWADSALTEETFGRLYTWYAATDSRGLCPAGWHLPSKEEWQALSDHLGGDQVSGGKLKEAGLIYWAEPNEGATNESGFSSLPGGYRSFEFFNIRFIGMWWTSTEYSENISYRRVLSYLDGSFNQGGNDKHDGFSVRCIKD